MSNRVAQITLAALALVTTAAAAANFHVASHGNDADPGTKEKPFATPTRAMEAVRALVRGGLQTDVRVMLHGGTYPLTAPLVFTSADSGSADDSITYAAAPGETVVISGGRQITNWMRVDESKWTTELAGVKSGQWFFRQLIVNDQRAVRPAGQTRTVFSASPPSVTRSSRSPSTARSPGRTSAARTRNWWFTKIGLSPAPSSSPPMSASSPPPRPSAGSATAT